MRVDLPCEKQKYVLYVFVFVERASRESQRAEKGECGIGLRRFAHALRHCQIFSLFGLPVTQRKVPIRTNKTKQIQAILLGFVWSGMVLLGPIWLAEAEPEGLAWIAWAAPGAGFA
jgi:hypothetical protein